MDNAKVMIEVTAGVLPPEVQFAGGDDPMTSAPNGQQDAFEPTGWTRARPEEEFSRTWAITSAEWDDAGPEGQGVLLSTRVGAAQGYATWLMLQPDRFNHVRVDWVWL